MCVCCEGGAAYLLSLVGRDINVVEITRTGHGRGQGRDEKILSWEITQWFVSSEPDMHWCIGLLGRRKYVEGSRVFLR